jgi:hypothetical protein
MLINHASLLTLIPFLIQPPCKRTLTGWGSRVYPNNWGSRVYTLMVRAAGCSLVGAAGCNLMVGAAGRGLVGAGGVLGLCPRSLRYALAAPAFQAL